MLTKKEQGLLKELGISHLPSERWYELASKLCHYLIKNYLKDSFEIYGKENLREDHYQLFLSNHELYTDPVAVQAAITLASGNNTSIPAPGVISYLSFPLLGLLMQKLYSYPIYSIKNEDIPFPKSLLKLAFPSFYPKENKKLSEKELTKRLAKKELSLDYSTDCLLNQSRLLVFPTGVLCRDGKQIKGERDDKQIKGRFGSADILWKAYHHIQGSREYWKEKKKGLRVIPLNISYYPLEVFRNRKNGSKIVIRFGEPISYREQVVDKFYTLKNRLFEHKEEKDEFKFRLQKEFMDYVMEKIGSLTTINMDQVCSRIIYDLAKKKNSTIEKFFLEDKIIKISNALRNSNLYFLDHFNDKDSIKYAYNDFLRRFKKEDSKNGYIIEEDSKLKLYLDKILSEPKWREVRDKNRILYNYNSIDHLDEYKDIEKAVLSD